PDAHGNLLTVTDARGVAPWTFTYDSAGQLTTVTIPGGTLPTSLAYDVNGNLTTIVDPLQHTTRASYDAASRLLSTTDPLGNLTEVDYDALNSLTAIADAAGGVTRFSYDGNGNLRTVSDARGGTTTYTYDVMDRVLTRTDPVNTTEQVLLYDGLGNVLQFRDRKGQSSQVAYDSLNRPLTASWADGTVTAYTWDPVDRLTSVVETPPSGGVTSVVNDFDVLDRLVTQTTALGSVSSTYDLASRRQTMNTTTYDWDEASNLKHITRPVPGGSLVASFTYDPVGRRSTRTVTAPTPSQGVSTGYTYDAASQLIGLTYQRNGATYGDLAYTYDAAGNRIAVGGSLARTLLPDSVSSAAYNAANRQTQFGASTMTFDANGNLHTLTDNQGTTLNWDARDRLVSLTRGDGLTAAFTYDGLGRRVSKTVNGATTSYAYDGRDILSTITANGSTDYLMGLPLDEPLARNGGTQFYLADVLGSVITLADNTGAGDTTYTYSPFGVTSSAGVASTNSLGFTGREADESGLYYHRARYYQPVLQRFVSEDRLQRMSRTNPYAYALNNPLRWIDPLGLAVRGESGGRQQASTTGE
ncbi:MAG: RHS repeat-associated core domain-containing protein, partial [Candidatus Rokubacteria bacterium]|nr:RHS repeat-associated core domain-containing protein [Candidatus Rokubacteria bacterium]